MKVIECEQKSKEWWGARRGVPSASEFHKIITPKTNKPSAQQDGYICKLIAEKYANIWPDESGFVSPAMQHGIDNEEAARLFYEFDNDLDVTQVGFCLSDCGRFGCSPDGLIGDDGGLEIKVPSLETQARYLLEGVLPPEYACQVHGSLAVTGRKWWDFVSYSEQLPTFKIRVEPDDFTKLLHDEVLKFVEKYRRALEVIQSKMC